MWWRARNTDTHVDRIRPAYPAFPFPEEDPLPEFAKKRQLVKETPAHTRTGSTAIVDADLPTIGHSILEGSALRKYSTYTSLGLKSYPAPASGGKLDAKI